MSLIDDKTLEEKLAASPAPRVTKEYIDSRVAKNDFVRMSDGRLTHCTITLDNGYTTTGESACVNPENYNEEIGQRIAYDNAYGKLWPLFGMLLAETQYLASKAA